MRRNLNDSSLQCFEFAARDGAKADAIARVQESWRTFLRIEQTQWRAANDIPAAGRFYWINSSLLSTDCDRADGNFLPRCCAARGRQFFWHPTQERKARCEPDAADSIFSRAVEINNRLCTYARVMRNFIQIE